jgi:hypothetical protein
MSSDQHSAPLAPLDLSKWKNVPLILIVVGAIGVGIGAATMGSKQFAYSWLVAFMFFLSLCLGGMFLTIVHHLFDASWSIATRRVCEHLACLAGLPMLLLFLPIAFLAKGIFPWMNELAHPDHALKAKLPLFTMPGFYIVAAFCFVSWWFFSNRLRYWSVQQDETGSVQCTRQMRRYAAVGVFFFGITLTFAAIMWMMGLMHEWFSTMYGVQYFAASAWTALATVYVMTLIMQRTTRLREIVKEKTFYMLGSLLFAFTVFYAYVSFAQYFIIWNANMPEETFWYVLREKGTWKYMGQYVIIFGHFFIPFLMLLRIDWKLKIATMLPVCAWAWLMHFCDMEFQIMPSNPLRVNGITITGLLLDIACMLFFAGVLSKVFLISFNRYAPFPQKDPRIAEAMDVYVPPTTYISTAPGRAK